MFIIISLLIIIAVVEVVRFYLTYKPITKKNHLENTIRAYTQQIWKTEFELFKLREYREGVRIQRDDVLNKIKLITDSIEKESQPGGLKEKNIDEFKRLEDEKVRLEDKKVKKEEELKRIDTEIEGLPPSADYPSGSPGKTDVLDELVGYKNLVKSYLKQI